MSPTNHKARTANAAEQAWADAYRDKAEIEARDTERADPPLPVVTMTALLIFSFVLLVVQCVFLPELR